MDNLYGHTIDRQRFELLYRLHWKQLRDYCYHHTQDQYFAEEIVQDIFLSIWERRATIGPIDNGFVKYLTRAAKLKLFDFHRHCASIKHNIQYEAETDRRAYRDTEERICYNELTENIHELICNLPYKSQEVYRLAHEQDLSKQEIARKLNISEKTVEYHLYKAVNLIRDRISKYGQG